MATTQEWIVCEKSGRWAAALRASMARQPRAASKPRLRETRSLGEFAEQLGNSACHLALVEVRSENLNEVFQLLTRGTPPQFRFAALLDRPPEQRQPEGTVGEASPLSLADLLWEIGAIEVLDSPRQIGRLIALYSRLLLCQGKGTHDVAIPPALADWAWSSLPWQDA